MKRSLAAKKRRRIRERDGALCWICGEKIHGKPTLDHVKPKSHGGGSFVSNLRLAHDTCNQSRGTKKIEPHPNWLRQNVLRKAKPPEEPANVLECPGCSYPDWCEHHVVGMAFVKLAAAMRRLG